MQLAVKCGLSSSLHEIKSYFKAWKIKPDFNTNWQTDSKPNEHFLKETWPSKFAKTRYHALSEVILLLYAITALRVASYVHGAIISEIVLSTWLHRIYYWHHPFSSCCWTSYDPSEFLSKIAGLSVFFFFSSRKDSIPWSGLCGGRGWFLNTGQVLHAFSNFDITALALQSDTTKTIYRMLRVKITATLLINLKLKCN